MLRNVNNSRRAAWTSGLVTSQEKLEDPSTVDLTDK